jgi:hypothetical protein
MRGLGIFLEVAQKINFFFQLKTDDDEKIFSLIELCGLLSLFVLFVLYCHHGT